jgi:tetratricopeptide (TPR) repeat protein
MKSQTSLVNSLLAIFLFQFLAVLGLHSQDDAGSIFGTVRDRSGSLLMGAKVTLKNEATSATIFTVTSSDGRYLFRSLGAGIYTLGVESAGFRAPSQPKVKVDSRQPVVVDFELVPENPEGKRILPNEGQPDPSFSGAGFYDVPQFKPGVLDGSVDPGGYSTPGRADASNRLLQGVVQLKADTPPLDVPSSTGKPVLTKKQDPAKLELKLKEVLRLNPRSFEANHHLGEFYIQQGKLLFAIPYLEKAQGINPSHYVNSYDLALAYLQTHNLSRARQQIQEMLQRKDTAELHNLLGEVEEEAGNSVTAANEYQRAAQMEPNEKHLFDWGNELLLHRAYEPAIQVLSRGVGQYPRSAKLRIGLGIALYSRSQYDDAVKSLCAAVDLDPSDPRPYFFLGKMYDVSAAMAEEVTRRLSQFVQLYPRNAQAHYYFALSLWKGQRGQDAQADLHQVETLFKNAASLDPRLSEPHLQLGILYANQRKDSEAIREYQMAIRLQPDLADAHYRLGQAYQRAGQKAKAREEMEIYSRLHKTKQAQPENKRGENGELVSTVKDDREP